MRTSDDVPVAEVETHGVEGLLATARERVEGFEPEEAWGPLPGMDAPAPRSDIID